MSFRQPRDAPADPPSDEENQSLLDNAPELARKSNRNTTASSFMRQSAPPRQQPQPSRSTNTATATSSSTPSPLLSAFDAMTTATNFRTTNPILLAKLVFHKFVLLLTSESEEDPSTRLGFTLALLKDIILGITFGLLTISLAVILDHRNIIHIESAHQLRDAAYSAMSDPETLQFIEAETNLKYMSFQEYTAARAEIESAQEKMEEVQSKLTSREKELEGVKEQMKALTEEKEALMMNPVLKELDNWCGTCSWVGRTNCDARVEYVQQNYNAAKAVAQMGLMKEGKCKKS